MKKLLIIFGSLILFLITFGTMFKLMHWPGAGPLLVLGIFSFAGFFLPLFFINRMASNPTGLNIITNIFALVSTILIFTGVLFKVMHWPGAAPMIVFGSFLFVFPTLILYVVQQFKEYDRKFSEFWRVVTMGILVSVFLMFWGSTVSRNILYADLKMEDATLESNKDLKELNSMLIDDLKTDSTASYSTIAAKISTFSQEMFQFIEEIKTEIVRRVEEDPTAQEDHWRIGSLDDYNIPTYILCGPNGKGRKLSEHLHKYKMDLKNELNKLPGINRELIETLGDFGVKTELNPELMYGFDSWEDAMFYNQTVSSSLALLTSVQHEVLNAELKCLKELHIMNRNRTADKQN